MCVCVGVSVCEREGARESESVRVFMTKAKGVGPCTKRTTQRYKACESVCVLSESE